MQVYKEALNYVATHLSKHILQASLSAKDLR